MLRLNKHTWSPHAARLSPYTVAVHWQTPGNVSENNVLGRENSFSISAHTPSHHCALQVGTSGEQPVLHYSPSLPTASPPEKATENEDLRECEVIKGSRAEDSKPQKPGTSLLLYHFQAHGHAEWLLPAPSSSLPHPTTEPRHPTLSV